MPPLTWKVSLAFFCTVSTLFPCTQDPQKGPTFLTHDPEVASGVAANVQHVDPAAGGWRSEVLHDAAKNSLKKFLGWLIHEKDLPSGSLADGFTTSALRPSHLDTVFHDGTMTVLHSTKMEAHRFGVDDIGGATTGLRTALEGGPVFNDFFKFISVELSGGNTFQTQFIMHLAAGEAPMITQVNIEGTITWLIGEDDEHVKMQSLEVHHYEELISLKPTFEDITAATFGDTPRWKLQMLHGVDQYMGKHDRLIGRSYIGSQGIAVGDINGDGRDDVYVPQQGGLPNRLYIHKGDHTVEEISKAAQVDFLDNTRAALILDLDNDGDQDLAMSIGSSVLLAFNNGQGVFDKRKTLRYPDNTEVFSLCAADPDNDGDLDIYASRYISGGLIGGMPTPYHDANNGSNNIYWRNDGYEWVDATEESGLSDNNHKFSLGAIWEDLDGDGDMDLYVANDFGRNNLYVNDGNGHFHDEGVARGADDIGAAMGVSVADANLDGKMDILVTNMFSSAGRRIATQNDKFMDGNDVEVHKDYVRHARGNSLLFGGEGTDFLDVTDQTRIAVGGWAWSAKFVDFNNDGFDDIYSPNGFLTNEDSQDL
ncbi:MAG: VCBS repeat-containing protein [Planctomycetota bacterium]|jgi:hypothetical protein|nr:VCBS repeat-containing protein [Planctomycetota bacterium]